MSQIETSRETLYTYFTNVESETIFKSNLSAEYNNTTISSVLHVNNFETDKYHYSLKKLELKSSLLTNEEKAQCKASLSIGFTVEKRKHNHLDILKYPDKTSEHCINIFKLIYSEIQVSFPEKSESSWLSFEYGFGGPILSKYRSFTKNKDTITLEKKRLDYLIGSEDSPIQLDFDYHFFIEDPDSIIINIDTKKKLIQSINGELKNTFSSSELKSIVSSRFHLSYISHGPSKEFQLPKIQITSENKDEIIYNNKKLPELRKIWKETKLTDAKTKLQLFSEIDKMLDNKQVDPKHIVELLNNSDFNDPQSSKLATVVAGAFAAHGSKQIEDALISMLEIDDYHTKLQAVMAMSDTPFTSMDSVNALNALLKDKDELSEAAILSLSSISQKMDNDEARSINRKAIESFISQNRDEKLILDAIGNSGDSYFLPYLKFKIASVDAITKRAAIYQLRNINSEEVDELILNLIHKETDHTIREEILNLLHARESTETSYELAISFYEAEESESLKSDALIAITNLGSCCIRDLQDRLIFISKNDSSDIIKSIAESYYNRITQ